jgi:hypothetical protein
MNTFCKNFARLYFFGSNTNVILGMNNAISPYIDIIIYTERE